MDIGSKISCYCRVNGIRIKYNCRFFLIKKKKTKKFFRNKFNLFYKNFVFSLTKKRKDEAYLEDDGLDLNV